MLPDATRVTRASLPARPPPRTSLPPPTRLQLALFALAYALVAVVSVLLLDRLGSPELALAALVAEAALALGLVLRFRVDAEHWRPYLLPGLGLAAACVLLPAWYARKAPWAMTPDFLVEELPIPEFLGSIHGRLQTKARLSGRVEWWDPYPFGKGLEDPLKVRLVNDSGSADVIVDATLLETPLREGEELEVVGRVRKWEGGVVRLIALHLIREPGGRAE